MRTTNDAALCNICSAEVPCQVEQELDAVYLKKDCPVHGKHQVVLSTDPNYWRNSCKVRVSNMLKNLQYSPHMVILEAIDECDLSCPMCIAASTSGSGNARPRKDLVNRVARLASSTGKLKLIMVSGGEPTLHPEIIGILTDLCSYADQVMLITNGVRIAEDQLFAKALATIGSKFQVYLQFDSMNPNVLKALRGQDYTNIRRNALLNLHLYNVATTLVCVIKRGQNESEMGKIIKLAAEYRNIKGVTFQPVRSSGRHADFNYHEHSITLSEVRTRLIEDLGCSGENIVPHPLNPERIAIGYFATECWPMRPLTSKILQTHSLYFDSNETNEQFGDIATLRVTIISFLDRFDFTRESSLQGGVVFLTDDEKVVPFDQKFLKISYENQQVTKQRSIS